MLNRLWLYLLSFSLINKKRRREREEKEMIRSIANEMLSSFQQAIQIKSA